jgi:hypothetical protein
MSRSVFQLPPDDEGHPVGRVEVDHFDDGDAIYLEVIDESVFGDRPAVSACVVLTREQAREIARALTEATS